MRWNRAGFCRADINDHEVRAFQMRRNLIVAGLLALLTAFSLKAADFKQVDKLVQPLIDGDVMVGCVVGIVDGDKHEVRGYGSIHHGQGDKPNGDTIYEIGSVTKTFTC